MTQIAGERPTTEPAAAAADLMMLEGRQLLSTFTVTNTSDDPAVPDSLPLGGRPGECGRGRRDDHLRPDRLQHAADDHPDRHPARAEHAPGR